MNTQRGAVLVVVLLWLLVLGLSTETAFRSTHMAQQVAAGLQRRANLWSASELVLTQQRDNGLDLARAQTLALDLNHDGIADHHAQLVAPFCVRADALVSSTAAVRYAVLWRQSVTINADLVAFTRHAWTRQVVDDAVYQRVCPPLLGESVPANP